MNSQIYTKDLQLHYGQVEFVYGMQAYFNVWKAHNIINYVNWTRMKHYMINSAHTEQDFGKIQHTFKIKPFSIVGREGNFLNLIKASTKNPS